MKISKLVPSFYLEQTGSITHTLFGETTEFWRKATFDMVDNGIMEVAIFNGPIQVSYQMSFLYTIMWNFDESLL